MGTYIDTDDMYAVYGQQNVIAWSDLTGGRTLDQTRVDAAINWAEKYVENVFRRSRYSVPFTVGSDGSYDVQLTGWMAVYAGDRLYKGRASRRGEERDDRTSAYIKETKREIQQVLGGQLELDAGTLRRPLPSGPIAIM
jgi:phage gp36-like protein